MTTSQSAYVVEWLRPTGWRQGNELFFRYRDAQRVADHELADKTNRAVRIRRVTLDVEPVFHAEQTYGEEAANVEVVG